MANRPTRWLSISTRKFVISFSITLAIVAMFVSMLVIHQARAASYCNVSYKVTGQWNGGFSVQSISIQNTSSSAWTNWTLTFAFLDSSQKIAGTPWNGTFTQSGQNVTVTDVSYNGNVAANGSVSPSPGFNGTFGANNPVPTNFAVNGNACNSSTNPTSTPTNPTSTPPTTPRITPTPIVTTPTSTPQPGGGNVGNATWFDALGAPYGGCGVPQQYLDSQNFVALNVQNTPGDYSTFFPRPITGANLNKIGFFTVGAG
jgi:hypothetical protein